ncbi:hypothetical protein EXIGLDRAFT_829520 [Exidia glandulosa HHB12029]|uniref:F-box domain-containing protein n=1 Tax=Exidia glandulosa HHB12029 TaxID=1314781 RepID=A0A166BKH9_EXIGL|nr:hypothetical protein EXIGLDRAFT_829520 [Exidia glandulosa HHB12029]
MVNWKEFFLDCAEWVVFSLVFLAVSPALILVYIFWDGPHALLALLFHVQLLVQDYMSERRRRRAFGDNSRNAAALFPHEVQLQIFGVIAAIDDFHCERGRDWHSAGSLARLTLVCRAWHGCATQQLYAHVHLRTDRACVRLAASLARRPSLANFIFGLTLPQTVSVLPVLPIELVRQYSWMEKGALSPGKLHWHKLKTAVDEIIPMCGACRTIHLGIDFGASHLRVYLPNLGHLQALSVEGRHIGSGIRQCAVDFPAADLHACLDKLTSVSISWCEISHGSLAALPSLQSLTLEHCHLDIDWLASVPLRFPNLRHYHLRHVSFTRLRSGMFVVFVQEGNVLESFTLVEPFCIAGPISLPGSHSWRTLTLSANLIWDRCTIPTNLEVLEFIPERYHEVYGRPYVITMVAKIMSHIPEWKLNSPKLHTLRVYAENVSNQRLQLESWKVMAVMLQEFCDRYGVRFDLSIRLGPSICGPVYEKRARDWKKRRLLWRDVL